MPIVIPNTETKTFAKPSEGELFGNLWSTKNIDLESNKGKIRLSDRMYSLFDQGDDADFELPVKFLRTDADTTDRWWVLGQRNGTSTGDGLLFKTTNTDPLTGWTQDAIASSPTDAAYDMEIFGRVTTDRLVVARSTNLSMLENGTWTASWWQGTLVQSALQSTEPHHLHRFLNLLLITDGNLLHIIDDSLVVVASRITLPKEFRIIWITDDGFRVYMGTHNTKDGQSYVFPWDGTSDTYDEPIPVYDSISLGGVAWNGVVYCVNGRGQLLINNGRAFEEIASFPVSSSPLTWADGNTPKLNMHPNGIGIIAGIIHMVINNNVNNSARGMHNMPSGVWVYHPQIGLRQKYSLSSYDNSTDDDWGVSTLQSGQGSVGAIVEIDEEDGGFLCGASVPTQNAGGSDKESIQAVSRVDSKNRGYIITPQMHSTEAVRRFWARMQIKFRKFENSTDRIVLKYRTDIDSALENQANQAPEPQRFAPCTWVTTSQFTTTDANFSNAAVDDEVEVLVGKGAGALAHITAISLVGGTYTVDLDEAIPNATGTFQIRVINWKKLGTISSQTIDKKLFRIAKRSTWIQLKIELRGSRRSPELEEFRIESSPSIR